MPQADINAVLRVGSPYEKGKFRIYEQLRHRQGRKVDAAFLKSEYGTGSGAFTFADGTMGGVAHSPKGISIRRHGMDALSAPDVLLTWEQAAELAKTPERSRAPLHPAPKRADDGQLSFADLSGSGSAVTNPVTAERVFVVPENPEPAPADDLSVPEEVDPVVTKAGTPDADAQEKPEKTLSDITPTSADMEEYDALQSERPGEFLAFQAGGYCLLFGAQAEIAAPIIGMKLLELDMPGHPSPQHEAERGCISRNKSLCPQAAKPACGKGESLALSGSWRACRMARSVPNVAGMLLFNCQASFPC